MRAGLFEEASRKLVQQASYFFSGFYEILCLVGSSLRVQLRWTGSQMALSFPSAPGHVYRLDRTDSLRPPAWFQVGSLIFGEGETVELSDPSPSLRSRFYRVVLVY